jgi:hypothetical protein
MNIEELNPEVFRRAAVKLRIVYPFCCDAIQEATNGRERFSNREAPHQAYFESLFKPNLTYGLGWWPEDDRESRLIALLLCAEILESEQKEASRKGKRTARK